MMYMYFNMAADTQIITFLINCLETALVSYWGTDIMQRLYQIKISFKQKLLFCVISGILLSICGLLPFSYFILCFLGIHILKLSRFKSIKIMRLAYIYCICCNLILKTVSDFIFPIIYHPQKWNLLQYISLLSVGTVAIYLFCRFISSFINKRRLRLEFSDNISDIMAPRELAKNFLKCCVIYAIVIIAYYNQKLDGIYCILMFLACAAYFGICIVIDYLEIYTNELANKDSHIIALNQTIQEFNGVKHDFHNILQTYSGFLAIEDYEKLKSYHKKTIGTIAYSENYLQISRRFPENPSFFSLILNKFKIAEEKNLDIHFNLMCDMANNFIDEFDFCRIMAILLDNAIEASEQTASKRMSLVIKMKSDSKKLLILTNDTHSEPDINDIYRSGYTTKPGHMGQGLTVVRSILHKHGNTALNIMCNNDTYTARLELWMIGPFTSEVNKSGKDKLVSA